MPAAALPTAGETAALVADASVDAALDPSSPSAADPHRPAAGLHWTVLPPLPEPRHDIRRSEATCGCSVVIGIIVLCVGSTHAAVAIGGMEEQMQTIFLAVVWAEALIALTCLLGLMFGDPGTIKRSEARCSPVPEGIVRDMLLDGQPLPVDGGLQNVYDATLGTYCVRCLVWRVHTAIPATSRLDLVSRGIS